jgi:hypothetical protein
MIEKIISGGQTGADQVALNAAIGLNISHGGWIKQQLEIWSVNEKIKAILHPNSERGRAGRIKPA